MLDITTPSPAESDETETLSENVFRRIQAAIVKGDIAPGSKISEPELARTYGISRGPLREAIHRLEGSACWCGYRMSARGWFRSTTPN